MSRPSAFHDLPASSFPFTIELIAVGTGEVVHSITVTDAGAVAIPGLAAQHGPIEVRMTFADGDVVVEQSPTPA